MAASSLGIGRATAEAFAAEGCKVAMCARNQQVLAAAAEKISKQYSAEVFHQALDVTDANAVHGFVEAVVKNSAPLTSASPTRVVRPPRVF